MENTSQTLRVLPIHVINPRVPKERALAIGEELESLIATLGGTIVERIMQKMESPDNATYIGKGKLQEVVEKVATEKIDVVVLNAMAKPTQVHAIKIMLEKVQPNIQVWDRVDLILHIFDKHATTTEAKLQIELARMRYMGPRIYGMGYVLSRQGGGIGTLGIGETNTELMKRHWRNEMKKITDKLDKISNTKKAQLEYRRRSGFQTVSIVGYTNAGKSSLFNLLTKKQTLVENALFATLDSSVGKVYVPQLKEEILLTDTIGFIRNLPPRLIQAFKSTLLESVHADVVLHVIDSSDEEFVEKIIVVDEILQDLGRDLSDVIFVFNKIDAAKDIDISYLKKSYERFYPIFISVKNQQGIDELLEEIARKLSQKLTKSSYIEEV